MSPIQKACGQPQDKRNLSTVKAQEHLCAERASRRDSAAINGIKGPDSKVNVESALPSKEKYIHLALGSSFPRQVPKLHQCRKAVQFYLP